MHKLPLLILCVVLSQSAWGQSPHGESFAVDCKLCHTSASWDFDASVYAFDHDSTIFPLEGQHQTVDCRSCHNSLEFGLAQSQCAECHQDIHNQTVGTDCQRCHNAESWLVTQISEIHEQNGFPLVGVHRETHCTDCHKSDNLLQFQPMGHECISCHQQDYLATTQPNHSQANYSTDCSECHSIFAYQWSAEGFQHDFFPLQGGHEIEDCASCHQGSDYADISSECISCHQEDYSTTANPDHIRFDFSEDCASCHTTDINWQPAQFIEHDLTFFPIYSGEHNGAWDDCAACHIQENDLSVFSCLECHEHNQADMDAEHRNVTGYSYNSTSCLACHPSGNSDGGFDHNRTAFPLDGAHTSVECLECHSDGYAGTSTFCADCHTQDFTATTNPNHQQLNLSNDCASCHTTDPEWSPASFAVHNDFYVLNGAHAAIASDCASCHNGDYSNTPNTCAGCHIDDYNATTNPPHQSSGFSNDCASCHSETAWQPADFDHDNAYFPIYSGTHQGAWESCAECHTTEGNFSAFSCLECHEHNQTDMSDVHQGISGYSYASDACLTCHPTGTSDGAFDHNTTNFPLTGAHTSVECLECHSEGYVGTSSFCADCHTQDFTATTNPNHQQLNLSNDCASCHTTDPGWSPASFAVHNDFYVLNGAHAAIASDCASCHNGDYSNTPNTCAGCHIDDYNATTNPPHQSSGFSNDCASCHSENAWQPADFDHDNAYFPIYSGTHQGAWESCAECHTTEGNFSVFSCLECHEHNQTDMLDVHQGISGYSYASDACLACHPTGTSDGAFDHNTTNFPLTGAHTSVECLECHSEGYAGTSTFCADCHTQDFTATTNPNHQQLNLSNDCASCHTTDPGWSPASFAVHNDFYVLNGAHAAIASDCASCHNGDYSNTPNTCAGCHIDDYNATTNPPHQSSGFSNDCASCHSETAWQPADFDHDNAYFPVYSGTHQGAWESCAECHTTEGNFSAFSCLECHEHNQTDMSDVHQGISGYSYASDACLACHPTGTRDGAFDHNTTAFPLTGAHTSVECLECHSEGYAGTSTFCADCHKADFTATTNPNHQQLNLSNDCASCHTTDPGWSPASFAVHNDFYVLNGAHAAIATDCASCHNGDYSNTPNTCAGCHIDDYNATTNPPHQASGFSNDCASCHSENAWQPADFDHDNAYFPIYSGTHQGAWESCAECHTTEGNFSVFSCLECHEHNQTDMLDVHQGISGYSYASDACLACHPTGTSDGAFDHNTTNFPLTGAHTSVECLECHSEGYAGTSTFCADCHTADFTATTNPNHQQLNLSNDCASCHTTDPGWSPASFAVHNDFYVLNGAHAAIATDCASCHNGDYSNTPNTCAGCHIDDYNATTNPPHQASGFSNVCASCHSENAWQPADFDHDNAYFPIYSGTHQGAWESCAECHTTEGNFSVFSCLECHEHNQTDMLDVHQGISGYSYASDACLACHPTGTSDGAFDHNTTNFPLTGAHTSVECLECHSDGYAGTSTFCADCHTADFTATTNPNHQQLNLSNDCASCHTTDPGWSPASFAVHNDFYVLNGAHAAIATDCASCHNGDYSNTPNTCAGCHIDDYNATTNPPHQSSGFSNDCASCHSENAWQPATFDHDSQFFPIYSGKHRGEWDQCSDCHLNANNYAVFSCIDCHEHNNRNEVDNDHDEVNGYQYNSNACLSCHPTGED